MTDLFTPADIQALKDGARRHDFFGFGVYLRYYAETSNFPAYYHVRTQFFEADIFDETLAMKLVRVLSDPKLIASEKLIEQLKAAEVDLVWVPPFHNKFTKNKPKRFENATSLLDSI